jgi:amino acid permease
MVTMCGIFVAIFHGQSSLPTLFQAMAEPERWSYVVGVGTLMCFMFYLSIGFVGYLTFGHLTQQSFTQNLGLNGDNQPVPYMTYAGPLSGGIVALKMIVSLPTFLRPITLFVEAKVGMGSVTRMLWKMLFVAGSTAVAVYGLDMFAVITAVFGASVHAILAILLPFACFLGVGWKQLCSRTKYLLLTMMLISYGITVPSTITSLETTFQQFFG